MGPDEEDNTVSSSLHPGSTLLPSPLATAISLVARSSSLYLRVGTFIGGLAIEGARVTTLASLEVSRAVIESILYRAGKDVSTTSTGELGRAQAESLLEKSVETLHKAITGISFAASSGFYVSAAALESTSDLSQVLLTTLDSILGSTDSSRAIASIITLIRREFQNPATGQEGEIVGVADLLLGICGLALLQRWCRRITDDELSGKSCEQEVWDVVVLDDGRRADMVCGNESGPVAANTMPVILGGEPVASETLEGERAIASSDEASEWQMEIDLKQSIIQSLPSDASVSITTSTTTSKTITVDIVGAPLPDLSPPPGVEIVEKNAQLAGDLDHGVEIATYDPRVSLPLPRYRVVYRILRSKMRRSSIQTQGALEVEAADSEEAMAGAFGHASFGQTASVDPSLDAQDRERRTQSDIHQVYRAEPQQASPEHGQLSNHEPSSWEIKNDSDKTRTQKAINPSVIAQMPGSRAPTMLEPRAPITGTPKFNPLATKPNEKKGSIRKVLKKGPAATLSNMWSKEPLQDVGNLRRGYPDRYPDTASTAKFQPAVPHRTSSALSPQNTPHDPRRGNANYFTSQDLGSVPIANAPRSPSQASYYSIHERRRESIVSQTDTYSIHSVEAQPVSPAVAVSNIIVPSTHPRASPDKAANQEPPRSMGHRRNKSLALSIYTLKANNSGASLVLAPQPSRSAFEDSETLDRLMRTGHVEGLFPQHHIIRNITRFVRFASASYGASFLRMMGIAPSMSSAMSKKEVDNIHHQEHHSFSRHTKLPPDTILLSSFVDPEGGADSTGHTGTGVPMVHFVTLDHDSKAVVLTCRGTLGFEDVLTDMTCDYDELIYNGKAYNVHMGIHASARRLLSSRVLSTIQAALEEFPEYGLVLCGHSLGGGVTALLAIMLSEPSRTGTSFLTTSTPQSYYQPPAIASESQSRMAPRQYARLPSGRPIHVYAYGPPATLSPSLRLATRGLITTIVNGHDLVPYLSLGSLHDLQAVALAFKTDCSGAKSEVRKRVWDAFRGTLQDKWYQNSVDGTAQKEEGDEWAYSALKTLRASMLSSKLLPPGEVFVVESMPVLRRDAYAKSSLKGKATGDIGGSLGRPATRSILRYVRDAERYFGELRFEGSMLLDHSPGRYETSLGALGRGVMGS